MPYNPLGNLQCERFNHALFGLMRTLDQEQKPNWPIYLPSLVYIYNTRPHSITGFQPYELMFGYKAPMPCENWIRLKHYKPDGLKYKTAWLDQQLNVLLYTDKQALKLIDKSTQHNKAHTGSKELHIPIGNHALLRDHPEGRNKIQDRYKSDVYVVIGHHKEPNIYYIKPLNKDHKGHPKVVNRHQIYDHKHSSPPSESLIKDNGFLAIPSFLNHNNSKFNIVSDSTLPYTHHYNTRPKFKAATTGRQAEVKTQVTHL